MTKSVNFIILCRKFRAGNITSKELVLSINKRYRKVFFNGVNATIETKNPYSKKENGFNYFRFILFEKGKELKGYFEPELF